MFVKTYLKELDIYLNVSKNNVNTQIGAKNVTVLKAHLKFIIVIFVLIYFDHIK